MDSNESTQGMQEQQARFEVAATGGPTAWTWQLIAADGEIVARSYGMYASKELAEEALGKSEIAFTMASAARDRDAQEPVSETAPTPGQPDNTGEQVGSSNGDGDEPEPAAAHAGQGAPSA